MSTSSPPRIVCAFFFAFIGYATATAQVIPAESHVDWKLAGIRDSGTAPTRFIDFTKVGGKGNGLTANDSAFEAVLASLQGEASVLFFPKGTYQFHKTLRLPSNFILQGEGSDSTKLVFNLNGEGHLIEIRGEEEKTEKKISADLEKDAYNLLVEDASSFIAGDYIHISDNDANLAYSGWALHSTGQIVRIKRVDGNILFLESPLRREYAIKDNPMIRKINPAVNVSIENIGIVRLDSTKTQTSNIQFEYASNCSVKCIESENCNFAHIEISSSTNIDVSGSYIHHAFSYGGGGEGYGVVLQYTSGECRITNNIFNTLRHSLLLQAGANGNVLSYNYSTNPTWDEPLFPKNYAGDIVLHGNYPYANLFEGNVVQNIVIDNSHGRNGMYNTFFRNRACLYGILMSDKECVKQNFIGNEITNKVLGSFYLQGSGHQQYANNLSGKILPAGTDSLTDKSLYLSATPDYYQRRTAWPPVGAPNMLNAHAIQSEDLFIRGFNTYCLAPTDTFGDVDTTESEDTLSDTVTLIHMPLREPVSIRLFPNPASGFVTIEINNNQGLRIEEVRVISVLGQTEAIYQNNTRINLHNLSEGIYIAEIRLSNGEIQAKRLVIKRQ